MSAFWLMMSASQNPCHGPSISKPKTWLPTEQILSLTAAPVSSKKAAPAILHSGAATLLWAVQHSALGSEGETPLGRCVREAGGRA